MKNIYESIEQIKPRMKGIEKWIDIYTTTITKTQARVSSMENMNIKTIKWKIKLNKTKSTTRNWKV